MGLVTERMEAWGGFFATQGALAPAGAGTREALGRAAWAHEAASPGLPMVLRDAAASVDPGGTAQPTVMRGASEAQLILAQDGGAERPSETPSAGTAAAEPPGLLERARDVVVDIFTGERRLTPEGRGVDRERRGAALDGAGPGGLGRGALGLRQRRAGGGGRPHGGHARRGGPDRGHRRHGQGGDRGLTAGDTCSRRCRAGSGSSGSQPAFGDARTHRRTRGGRRQGHAGECRGRAPPRRRGIAWLESGSSRAGLQHIIARHGEEFAARGIPEDRIADAVLDAVETGRVVGVQGRPPGRPIYEFTFDGQMQRMAVTIGDNGFIVGANPK